MTKLEAKYFSDLVAHLADLYGTDHARLVVQESGLDPSMIDMSGSAIRVWSDIVSEARKSPRGVVSLLQTATRHYPDNQRTVALFSNMPPVDIIAVGIEQLSQQVAGIDRKVSALGQQVNGLSQQVAGLSAQVSANQGA